MWGSAPQSPHCSGSTVFKYYDINSVRLRLHDKGISEGKIIFVYIYLYIYITNIYIYIHIHANIFITK